jgi:hypothetical protein
MPVITYVQTPDRLPTEYSHCVGAVTRFILFLVPGHGRAWRPTPTNWRIAPRRDCAFEAHTDPVDKTIGEIRMNMIPTLCLTAVLAGPLHAQECSGGAAGGLDATGNQCGDAAINGLNANGSDIASSRLTAKMSGAQQPTAATAGTRPTAKMSAAPATSTVSAPDVSRIAKAAIPPIASVKASKIEAVDASPCAGGPDGGMDATGNQCAEHPVAGMNTGNIVAAKH